MSETTTYFIFSGILGLVIGSFLNCCIFRIPRGISLINPKTSVCPHCEKPLKYWHNIPIVSFFVLQGKCGFCKDKISLRYLVVELLSLINALCLTMKFGWSAETLVLFIFTSALIVISYIDLDFQIIPDVISKPGVLIGLLLALLNEHLMEIFHYYPPKLAVNFYDSIVGAFLGWLIFTVLRIGYYLIAKIDGLGGGDIKLMAMCGAWLGMNSIYPSILIGSIISSVVGIGLIITQKYGRKSELPFGPSLALGMFCFIYFDSVSNFMPLSIFATNTAFAETISENCAPNSDCSSSNSLPQDTAQSDPKSRLSNTPQNKAEQIYKWKDKEGRIHFSTKKSLDPSAAKDIKALDLPELKKENLGEKIQKLRASIPQTCSNQGGIDCRQGEDTDGSVICTSGYKDSKESFKENCLEAKLVAEYTLGKAKLILRNTSTIKANGIEISLAGKALTTFDLPQDVPAIGPSTLEPYDFAEYAFPITLDKELIPFLNLKCDNCYGIRTLKIDLKKNKT